VKNLNNKAGKSRISHRVRGVGGGVEAHGQLTLSQNVPRPGTEYKRSRIAFCKKAFTDVHICTELLQLPAQSLIGSPGTLVAKTHRMPQVMFRKRATDSRAFLRKMTYEEKISQDSTPPCSIIALSHLQTSRTKRAVRNSVPLH